MGWLEWLGNTAVGTSMRESAWMYPAAETVHLLGLGLLVGSATLFDLRLLGVSARLPVTGMAEYLLPCARTGFVAMAISGLLLFTSDPVAFAANPAFRVKLLLISVAGLNAALFHAGPFRSVARWDQGEPAPRVAKAIAVLSLSFWILTVCAGRLIAYV